MRENYKEYEFTKIRFGKYKGKTMCNVPTDYLIWAIKNISDQGIATMFSVELMRRDKSFRRLKL
jgi:uncharacterized protein (DUF3820 family)